MRTLILPIFLFLTLSTLGQQTTWNTLLPDYVSVNIIGDQQRFAVRQMAKTSNNEYIVLMNKIWNIPDGRLDTTVIIKYDDLGQLIWQKEYHTLASYRSMQINSQGEIILHGYTRDITPNPSIASGAFMKLSGQGDSLATNYYDFNNEYFETSQGFQENDNSYWVVGVHMECYDSLCNSYTFYDRVLNLDSTGVIIDSLTSFNNNSFQPFFDTPYLYLISFATGNNTRYEKYNIHTDQKLIDIILPEENGSLTAKGNIIYAMNETITQFDDNFNQNWFNDGSSFLVDATNEIFYETRTSIVTADNGCAFGGFYDGTGPFETSYLVKFAQDGTLEWYRYLQNTPLYGVEHLIEADDGGFVFIGYSNNGQWIVKVDNQGLFTNTFEPKEMEFTQAINIDLYPNPVVNMLHLRSDQLLSGQISIININGQTILEQNINELYQTRIDVSHLASGVYILRYIDDETFFSKKWIKN